MVKINFKNSHALLIIHHDYPLLMVNSQIYISVNLNKLITQFYECIDLI